MASLQLQGSSKSTAHQSRLISMLRENILRTDKENLLQNLIATMILYQYEVWTTDNRENIWASHLCGAKKIMHASAATLELFQHESSIIMDWIYYHEVISEFSLRHWAKASTTDSFCKGPMAARPKTAITDDSVIPSGITCPMDALELIQIICKRSSAYDDFDVPYDNRDMEQMRRLKHSIYETVGESGTFHEISREPLRREEMLTYLYRCAALIYLNRAVLRMPSTAFQHRRLVREGILLLKNLGFCETAWPLFLIACEAGEDDQRLQISEILSETTRQSRHRSNHIPLIQSMVEAIWNQNDLNLDSEIDYVRTLYTVVSTAPSLPLFA
ncbi:uncharacterized protein N7482_009504 [Penicillium canariense]|uniref:Uncharacterized protein n=1 Tax=Penicillium canariense TaxID=189055 RepID=A0A9W9HNY6_9EURO|nr:uncharacterized protein N7482_009504 [Penicillium canariense]KAJ5153026.1 hypothetical protein N7482_009504 [Penicillium canariense]